MLAMLGLAASVGEVGVEPDAAVSFVLAYASMRLLLTGLYLRARRHVPAIPSSRLSQRRVQPPSTASSPITMPIRPPDRTFHLATLFVWLTRFASCGLS